MLWEKTFFWTTINGKWTFATFAPLATIAPLSCETLTMILRIIIGIANQNEVFFTAQLKRCAVDILEDQKMCSWYSGRIDMTVQT